MSGGPNVVDPSPHSARGSCLELMSVGTASSSQETRHVGWRCASVLPSLRKCQVGWALALSFVLVFTEALCGQPICCRCR